MCIFKPFVQCGQHDMTSWYWFWTKSMRWDEICSWSVFDKMQPSESSNFSWIRSHDVVGNKFFCTCGLALCEGHCTGLIWVWHQSIWKCRKDERKLIENYNENHRNDLKQKGHLLGHIYTRTFQTYVFDKHVNIIEGGKPGQISHLNVVPEHYFSSKCHSSPK